MSDFYFCYTTKGKININNVKLKIELEESGVVSSEGDGVGVVVSVVGSLHSAI